MGQEIASDHFTNADFQEYTQRLRAETCLLETLFNDGKLSARSGVGGFEIEGWLVDRDYRPAPCNARFLQLLGNPLVTTELAKFNIELNTDPLNLQGPALSRFDHALRDLLAQAQSAAGQLDSQLVLIGTLPSVTQADFSMATMTDSNRYHALNNQVLNARHSRPLRLDIEGNAPLHIQQETLMLEAATTSLQIHLQLPALTAHHYYNAALLASGPIMAIAGNSPFLFGHPLWQETRIPVFEQAVDVGPDSPQRVSFGSGFAHNSILECFQENLERYPLLLPMLQDKPPGQFAHLRLHNGVIWRWNRPLIGFDDDGTAHVRLEHRILPAGPSVPDMLANAALFYGLARSLGAALEAGGQPGLSFAQARTNFYAAARHGLSARLFWEGREWTAPALLAELLPLAEQGLQAFGLDEGDIQYYLGIIAARTESGQTGAVWQQHHMQRSGGDVRELLQDYVRLQHTHTPVHEWA